MLNLTLIAGLVLLLGLLIWGAVKYGRRLGEKSALEADLDAAGVVAEEQAKAKQMSDEELEKQGDRWRQQKKD